MNLVCDVHKINQRLDSLEQDVKHSLNDLKNDYSVKLDRINNNFNMMNKLLESKLNNFSWNGDNKENKGGLIDRFTYKKDKGDKENYERDNQNVLSNSSPNHLMKTVRTLKYQNEE